MTALATLSASEATVALDGTTLLAPTSLSISAGEIWCVSGENGSGKTTLLRAFLDSNRLTSGTCQIFGQAATMSNSSQRALVSALVDPVPIARDLTLVEQIHMVAVSWSGNTHPTQSRVREVLEQLNLSHLADRFVHQISAGQLQLFNLALVFVRPARVILLDEPERHLDDRHIALLLALIRLRATQGTTFLMATHEPAIIAGAHGHLALG